MLSLFDSAPASTSAGPTKPVRFTRSTPAIRGKESPMSNNLKTMLRQAAELRAVGHPWETVAKRLHRSVKTCQNWPGKYPREWAEALRPVQLRLFEQISGECETRLHALTRHKDPKIQAQAVGLWVRHGAKAFGRDGGMTEPAPGSRPEGHPNEQIHARLSRVLD